MAEALTGVNGEIIKWARLHYNLIPEDVALSLKISVEEYLDWERGQGFPSYAKLKQLSNIFKKPVAIFFMPDPPKIKIKGDLRSLSDIVKNSLSKKVIQALERAKGYQLNLKELFGDRETILSKIDFSNDIQTLSKQTRSLLQFPINVQKERKDAKTVLNILREKFYDLGIYIFKDSFKDDGVSGLCVYDDKFPVILINNKMAFTRQLFTVFHELYHLYSKVSGIEIISDDFYTELTLDQSKIEKKCDSFANEFLIPTEDFLVEIKGRNIDESLIKDISNLYCVSREAILYKLYDLNMISSSDYAAFKASMGLSFTRESGGGSGGNYFYTKYSYLGQKYTSAIFEQLYSGKIDKYKASEFLGTKVNSLSKFEAMMFRGEV